MSLPVTSKLWRRTFGALAALLLSVRVAATTLELEFVDTEGQFVSVAKAELLLVAWGETQRIVLDTEQYGMTLSMDSDWLRSRWPRRFDDQEGVYLYLQAPPFASIRSERFKWLGAGGNPGPVTIAFPSGMEVVVEPGTGTTATIMFRPKATRRVRIVDPSGSPRTGMAVNASMFWSQSNHCGSLTGGHELLGRHVTDADGWIEVPDGDFEYALELANHRFVHAFVGATGIRYRLVTHLSQPETQMIVREYPIHPLEMRVWRAGKPAAGATLEGWWANCPCGACKTPVAEADAEGRISLPDFRPEEWFWVGFWEGDERLWSSGTRSVWYPTGVVEVHLPARGDKPPP